MQPGSEDIVSSGDIIGAEREILRAVLRSLPGQGGALLRQEELRRLADYRFRDPTHQVIFDALCALRSQVAAGSGAGQESIHGQLLQHLTRKGFPDVDLKCLFQPSIINAEEIQRLVIRLTTTKEGTTGGDER